MSVRILIVEDHPANQKLMSYLLESRGYQVLVADTGEEALELVEREDFDLILCDIRMTGMDGDEVARRLKADPRHCRIPLVAITALVHPGDRDQMLMAGFDGFISKAASPHLFVQQVQSFLPGAE